MLVKNVSLFTLVAVLMSGLLIGCGGGDDGKVAIVSVKGKVLLDGKPHGPAKLNLEPIKSGDDDTRPVIGGVVEADGSFTLSTYDTGDGAPPGDYNATLADAASGDANDPMQAMAAMGGGGPTTAPLKVTIPKEGSDSLELKFASAKAAPKKKTSGGAPPPL